MDTIKKYGGPVGFVAVVALLAAAFVWVLAKLGKLGPLDPTIMLPLLSIGGVIALLLVLTIAVVIFGVLGLADKGQAMGLPEGSVRAVIALSLVVLFPILAVFLYQTVSTGGRLSTIENVPDSDRIQFIKEHLTARDLQAVLVRDEKGQPLKNPDGTPKNLYTVTYRSANGPGDDFAKQLFVLLGTLMTAVTSFYLGARTATSATTVQAGGPPRVSGTDPTRYSFGSSGNVMGLKIMGSALNDIIHVKIVKGGEQLVATEVTSNPTLVSCRITGDPQVSLGQWDVVVEDGAGRSASLKAQLTIEK